MLQKFNMNLYVDEAGFNLAKTRRGRNVIGHRAITNVPGQRGGNITLCAAITQNGVLHHHANLGPYNANLILAFLHRLHEIVTALNQVDQMRYMSFGTMSHSIGLLRSRIGSMSTLNLKSYTFPHTPPS